MSWKEWRKHTLYIAKFDHDEEDEDGNVISVYSTPEYLGKFNIQPLSASNSVAYGGIELQEFGNRVNRIKKVYLEYDEYYGRLHENDLAYLDNITPEGETVNGQNANYTVYSVRPQNRRIAVFFQKLPNKE